MEFTESSTLKRSFSQNGLHAFLSDDKASLVLWFWVQEVMDHWE